MSKQRQESELYRYLLGDLAVEDRDRLEELYFTDDDALDRLLSAENELIESYVGGRMSKAEREKFAANYLTTPERRRRVELVEQLKARAALEPAAVAREPEGARAPLWQKLLDALFPQSPSARAAFAFGVVAVVFGSAFLFSQTINLRTRLRAIDQDRAAARRAGEEARHELSAEREQSDRLREELARKEQDIQELGEAAAPSGGAGEVRERPTVVAALDLGFGPGDAMPTFAAPRRPRDGPRCDPHQRCAGASAG